jgi:hypothetical protein
MDPIVVVAQVFRWLWREYGKPWSQLKEGSRAHDLATRLMSAYRPIGNDGELDHVVPAISGADRDFGGAVLYLRPIEKSDRLIPLLTASCRSEPGRRVVRFQVGLFALNGNKVVGVGYRFEPPESATGLHCYYHAQPIRVFAGKALPGLPPWIAESTPAFPLDAADPARLVLCLFVSLYGYESLTELMSGVGTMVQPYVKELHMRKSR